MTPDEIMRHVNYFNNGAFCDALFEWAGIAWPVPDPQIDSNFVIESHLRHLTFHLNRIAFPPESRLLKDWNDVVLQKVQFDAMAALPFGLTAMKETPETATVTLGTDTFAVDQHVTYFMPDGLAVGVEFKSGMIGIKEVIVGRLGFPLDWLAMQ